MRDVEAPSPTGLHIYPQNGASFRKQRGYVGLPQGGEGGPRQWWMRMSAHTCRESTLPSACLWVCTILCASRMAAAPRHALCAGEDNRPTGLCTDGMCIGDCGTVRCPRLMPSASMCLRQSREVVPYRFVRSRLCIVDGILTRLASLSTLPLLGRDS